MSRLYNCLVFSREWGMETINYLGFCREYCIPPFPTKHQTVGDLCIGCIGLCRVRVLVGFGSLGLGFRV